MSNSFSFDSVDMNGSSYGLTLVRQPIPRASEPVNIISESISGAHRVMSLNRRPQIITLDCALDATSQADIQTKMDAFLRKTDPKNGDKQLAIDQLASRYWLARRHSDIEDKPTLAHSFFSVEFLATDQYPYSTSETDSSIAIATNPDTLVVSSPAGNVQFEPVWYIRNSTGGAVTSIKIENDTLPGNTLTYTGSVGNGKWLRIGSQDADGHYAHTIGVSTASNADPTGLTYGDGIGSLTSGFVWPKLKPGENNSITVTGIGTGTLQWVFKGRY